MNTVAVIQSHCSDLLNGDRDPSHYCVASLKKSRHIERIVVAAPDVHENSPLCDAADRWGIDCFLGSEFDVTSRIIEAAGSVGADDDTVLVRVLLNRFFLDIDLVDRTVDRLVETGSDLVLLPYDFNINFGADVLTLRCLKRADEMTKGGDEAVRFRPWLFMEEHTEAFKVAWMEDVPTYPRETLESIRTSELVRERDCCGFTAFTYEFAMRFVEPSDVALDLGCGVGDGAAILADHVAAARGADYDAQAVAEARQRHGDRANLEFDVEDAHALDYADGSFDLVLSSNSLEHVEDDALMLRNCYRVLRSGGRLILEVPLLAERPFGVPLFASHLREYRPQPLLDLVAGCGFAVDEKFGVNRGVYVDWDRARESVLLVAHKV